MSANYFELLKYAATGIASPSMTYYDKMRASTLMGGVVQTLTGIPPLTFKADGNPLISWSMKGNGVQSGTPTPDAPIMPTFCGVRTAQLFEGAFGGSIGITGGIAYNEQYEVYYAKVEAGLIYTISGGHYVYAYYSDIPSVGTGILVDNTRHFTSQGNVITVIDGASWIGVRVNLGDKPMLNLGSTALPYEPYGWAEKITCAGQTVPVYLGQTQTVRRIKKLVLTGEDGWDTVSGNAPYRIILPDIVQTSDKDIVLFMTTHYLAVPNSASWSQYTACVSWGFSGGTNLKALVFRDTSQTTLDDFKTYLAAQYAAGTPVTVWYVLADEQTGIVNEPLCKIGDYADELHSEDSGVTIPTAKGSNTLSVDTTVQPSEMTIMYRK